MKSRLLFRESGHPIRTRSAFDPWWTVAALIVVMAFYCAGAMRDQTEPKAKAEGIARGQAEAIVMLQPMIDRAYEAGRAEGRESCLVPTVIAAKVRQ